MIIDSTIKDGRKVFGALCLLLCMQALLTFVIPAGPWQALRIVSGAVILFIAPGILFYRMVSRSSPIEPLDGLLIVLLSSVGSMILWAFILNKLGSIPFTETGIFFMATTLIFMLALTDILLARASMSRFSSRIRSPPLRK